MTKTVQKPQKAGSTQKFTGIQDIQEDIVILDNGYTCLVIEVQATNFDLLSQREQHAKITSYASLLNSLSFPIQIIIRNKRVDVSLYVKRLEAEEKRVSVSGTQGEKLAHYISRYRGFVEDLVKVNSVLDKKCYMVISFSSIEKNILHKDDFISSAKAALRTRADSLLTQLSRLNLHAKVLQKDVLIGLFYDIFNQGLGEIRETDDMQKPFVVRSKPV